MNKKQAQQEILRRLANYLNCGPCAEISFNEYHSGELSKQELIRMITLDEDGNLLSEPLPPNYDVEDCVTELGKQEVRKAWLIYGEKKTEYQKALNKATEIVNFYDGNC